MALRKLGSLWWKRARNNKAYLSGELEILNFKIPVVILHNSKKKKGSNQPDYIIYLLKNPEKKLKNAGKKD